MNAGRILYGLDRPPRGIAWDHPRLPGVTLGTAPLRLNSQPVPAAFLAAGILHGSRRAAVQEWLQIACGDYAIPRVRFITRYLQFIEAELQRSFAELEVNAAAFGGLYRVEDWLWSALRPLPRAWIALPSGPSMADFAFWDGARLVTVDVGMTDAAALRGAGVLVLQAASDEPLEAILPETVRDAWRSDLLPSSPFRRPIGPL